MENAAGDTLCSLQVARLNSDLVDITTLYQDWAEPYQLWECKLAILQCAGWKVLSEQLNPLCLRSVS